MNVVNTRTNILCIHGCHTRTNHKKISSFVFMVVTQEPTIRKFHMLLHIFSHVVTHVFVVTHVLHVATHVFQILEIFLIKKTSSIKTKVQMPKVLQNIHAWLHEDMQQVQLGGMLGLRNVAFSSTFPFTIPYISSSH
jgi:hypothetical protein